MVTNTKNKLDSILEANCVKTDGYAYAGIIGGIPTIFLHSIKDTPQFEIMGKIASVLAKFCVSYVHYIFNSDCTKLYVDNNGVVSRRDDLCKDFSLDRLVNGYDEIAPFQRQFARNVGKTDIDFIYFGRREIVLIDAKTCMTSVNNYQSSMRKQNCSLEAQYELALSIELHNIKCGDFWVFYSRTDGCMDVYPLQVIKENGYYTFDMLNTESIRAENIPQFLIDSFGVSWWN